MRGFKKINKGGGITLPIEIRRDYGFNAGQGVDISIQGDELVIRKYVPRCLICGNDKEVVKYVDRHICKVCIKKMSECL